MTIHGADWYPKFAGKLTAWRLHLNTNRLRPTCASVLRRSSGLAAATRDCRSCQPAAASAPALGQAAAIGLHRGSHTKTVRGIDRATLAQVTDLAWIKQHLNVLITGPTGVGKSYLASAIAHAACRADYAVRTYRLPRLVDELTKAGAMHNRSSFFRGLAKIDLLLIDDFGIAPIAD
jgi:hypothetical protein